MAKLLKHLGIGVKKTPSTSSSTPPSSGGTSTSHRAEYNSAQKSTSVQELLPKSPTRYRSSGSLSTNVNHDFDTQSLKSFFDGQQRSVQDHRPSQGVNQHGGSAGSAQHGVGRHRGDPGSLSPKGGSGGSDGHYPAAYGTSVMSVTEEGEVFDSSPGTTSASLTSAASTNHTATPVYSSLLLNY